MTHLFPEHICGMLTGLDVCCPACAVVRESRGLCGLGKTNINDWRRDEQGSVEPFPSAWDDDMQTLDDEYGAGFDPWAPK